MSDEKILTKAGETLIAFESQNDFPKINENILHDCIPESVRNYKFKLPDINNPVVEELQTIHNETTKQTKELQHIRYENIKLNAQIDTLNKTIESKDDELDNLRNINAELKIANKTLKDSNSHYWRNTFIISFVVAAIFFVLGYII